MKAKIINGIRKILIKKILPAREKKEKILSKIRLSMELRITIHYFFLFLIVGLIIFGGLAFLMYQYKLDHEPIRINIKNHDYELEIFRFFICSMAGYIILTTLVVCIGRKGLTEIFQPIQEMSERTNQITVNNLQEERLNLEGTKNELKDLASTINAMLDRIEVSYESQKQFVSDASHELRTPIAVIQGYVNLLDRWGKKDEEVLEESIEAIKNEAQEMQDLVERLLFLSRHDKKTLKLNKKVCNIKEHIEELLKETELVAADRKVEAILMEDAWVYVDAKAIKQAVRVFVENAVKYSKDGDSIYLACEQREKYCVITVADTGIGMQEKDMEHIFQRFYRSDKVRDQKIAGHGLGLSIAKLIVMKHAGTIKVRSQYGKGTCFQIFLPKVRVNKIV